MTIFRSKQTKDKIRDGIENGFDKLHHLADKLPLAGIDGIIHGTARGIFNWLLDYHPDKGKTTPHNNNNNNNKGNGQYQYQYIITPDTNANTINWIVKLIEETKNLATKEELRKIRDELISGQIKLDDAIKAAYASLKLDINKAVNEITSKMINYESALARIESKQKDHDLEFTKIHTAINNINGISKEDFERLEKKVDAINKKINGQT